MNARVSAILAFRLTTADPERLVRFYTGLGFAAGEPARIPDDELALLGVSGGTRIPLRVGAQHVDIDCFESPGRAYPEPATSADLIFQHFALVTDDAAEAWALAMRVGATPISCDGPVTLPASAGGATAAKFRDPEGHPLEFLQFPHRSGSRREGSVLLGIDHSAIGVSDLAASLRFYKALGLSPQHANVNRGPTQAALDGLADVEVDVVPLTPSRPTPHFELLHYRRPVVRESPRLEANDVAATRTVWAADREALIRDPDGHLHVIQNRSVPA